MAVENALYNLKSMSAPKLRQLREWIELQLRDVRKEGNEENARLLEKSIKDFEEILEGINKELLDRVTF